MIKMPEGQTTERDEWVRRVGTAGWEAEMLRRRAVRLSTSPYATPEIRERWTRWLAAHEHRGSGS